MSDEVKHECAVAMVVMRTMPCDTGDFGGAKLSLLLEKQHNRGQDGAGAAILRARPVPGETPYWIAKSASATPLVDVLGAIARRRYSRTSDLVIKDSDSCSQNSEAERIFLGHLRYATFGKNEVAFCHPFVHEASELAHTFLLAGNFNLTNARELFDDYSRHGSFPTSKSDGYLICEMIAHELARESLHTSDVRHQNGGDMASPMSETAMPRIASALSAALANADGAWTLCGATGDGWAFATRDPNGIRPGFYYISDDIVAVASERPAIQAAFDVTPEEVKELPPGQSLVVSPSGEVIFERLDERRKTTNSAVGTPACLTSNVSRQPSIRPCSFERIYFSRANDADIHRERKALGAALLPRILKAAEADMSDIFFSYIPNSARIAFHGLLEELIKDASLHAGNRTSDFGLRASATEVRSRESEVSKSFPRFGEVIVKDAKFRTFIADAAARREFYKHIYDVTYGLVRPGVDTLVVLDDSIVRGNTMKNAILPMLDRLGPKRIVIASSAPPIRYPDCYGIDMSTLGELVAFRALVNLLGADAEELLTRTTECARLGNLDNPANPLDSLYARFTDEQHCAEIARLLTPPGMKAEVRVVYQTVEGLQKCLTYGHGPQVPATEALSRKSEIHSPSIGDWYFTGKYPTPGGYKVLQKALENYLKHKIERSY